MTEKAGLGQGSRIYCLQSAYVVFVGLASAYLTMITHYSPFYFGYLIAFSCMMLSILYSRRFQCDRNMLSIIIWTVLAMLFALINSKVNGTFYYLRTFFLQIILNQGSLFLAYSLLKRGQLGLQIIKKGINLNFYVTAVLGVADFVHRVLASEWFHEGGKWFYNLKFHSYMFLDTNWSGFAYMITFAFYLYLRREHGLASRSQAAVLFGLVILSFSRAAMICSVLVWLWAVFVHHGKGIKKAVCCMLFLIFLISAGAAGFLLFKNDGSFIARLSIIDGMIYYMKHAGLSQLLLGNGFNADESGLFGAAWTFKHLYFVIKIVDIGIIGTVIEMSVFVSAMIRTKGEILYLLIPFLIAGLSFSPTNLSYLYIFAGIILYIEHAARSGRQF